MPKNEFKIPSRDEILQGITDLKKCYKPNFGFAEIKFDERKKLWQEVQKNILEKFAPKH